MEPLSDRVTSIWQRIPFKFDVDIPEQGGVVFRDALTKALEESIAVYFNAGSEPAVRALVSIEDDSCHA
jgi:hypothetical protein